jgi:pSer/pThr/pTyr-binding forkhead associated (FHA) protein
MTEARLFLRKVKTGEEFVLQGVTPVGREIENGINLLETGASRQHATLKVIEGAAYLEDEGSRNGTSLNSKSLPPHKATRLQPGDRIKFNTEEFEFRVDTRDATVAQSVTAQRESPRSWAEVQFNTTGSDGTEKFDANQLKEYLAKAKERQQRQAQLDIKEPCLQVFMGDQTERTMPLIVDGSPVQEWTVGRSADSAIRLDDVSVSDRQAKIVREGARWKLLDAISSNGTYVNDLQVGMCYLTPGDGLRFGRVHCVFNLPSKSRGKRRDGRAVSLKKIFLTGLAVSFIISVLILAWLFRSQFL